MSHSLVDMVEMFLFLLTMLYLIRSVFIIQGSHKLALELMENMENH